MICRPQTKSLSEPLCVYPKAPLRAFSLMRIHLREFYDP